MTQDDIRMTGMTQNDIRMTQVDIRMTQDAISTDDCHLKCRGQPLIEPN